MNHLIVSSFNITALAVCLSGASASAQTPTPTPAAQASPSPSPSPRPQANPADVATIESTVAALYDAISGPAGKKRDWDRFRSLFAPGARLIPTSPRRPPGTAADAPLTGSEEHVGQNVTVEDYIRRGGPYLEERGFYEREVARRVEQFGHIAHVFSTYETRSKPDDPAPFMRGINSFQLMYDGKRWWVFTALWEAETPVTKLPEKYLKNAP